MCRNHSHVTIVIAEGVNAGPLSFFVVETAQELVLESPGGIKTTLPRGRFLYFLPTVADGVHVSPGLIKAAGLAVADLLASGADDADAEVLDRMVWLGGA